MPWLGLTRENLPTSSARDDRACAPGLHQPAPIGDGDLCICGSQTLRGGTVNAKTARKDYAQSGRRQRSRHVRAFRSSPETGRKFRGSASDAKGQELTSPSSARASRISERHRNLTAAGGLIDEHKLTAIGRLQLL